MLNGRYFSFLLSLSIHFALVLVLLPYNILPVSATKKKTAIKSYLYKKPMNVPQQVIKENNGNIKPEANKQALKAASVIKKPLLSPKTRATNTIEKISKADQQKTVKPQTSPIKPVKKFDAREQLANFRSQLNRQILQEEFTTFNRPRNLSGMNTLPQPVPHARVKENEIIKKEKATTYYTRDIAIIKLDDGLCVLKQHLSNIGMDGITAVSGFKCGRTKMEKAFSTHMNNINSIK